MLRGMILGTIIIVAIAFALFTSGVKVDTMEFSSGFLVITNTVETLVVIMILSMLVDRE